MNKRKCIDGKEVESKKVKIEWDITMVLCDGEIGYCILSYLKPKHVKRYRLTSRAIAKVCFHYMLDRFTFSMKRMVLDSPDVFGEEGLCSILPRVPKRVSCISAKQMKLIPRCEVLSLRPNTICTDEPLCWPEGVKRIEIRNLQMTEETTLRLPEGVTHVTFSSTFSYSSKIGWPKTIEHVYIDKWFHGMIPLPPWLKSLTLNSGDNINIDGLPPSLEYLDISGLKRFSQPLENLPINLKTLHLPYFGAYVSLSDLPPNLVHLSLRGWDYDQSLKNLPRPLKVLDLSHLGYSQTYGLDNLPPGLSKLYLPYRPYHYVSRWPRGLTHLICSESYHTLYDIPDGIVYLDAGAMFNDTFDRWPASLKWLVLPNEYDKPLPKALLDQLDRLFSRYGFVCKDEDLPEPFKSAAKVGKLSRKPKLIKDVI